MSRRLLNRRDRLLNEPADCFLLIYIPYHISEQINYFIMEGLMRKIFFASCLFLALFIVSCNSGGNPIASLIGNQGDFKTAVNAGQYGMGDYCADSQGNIYHQRTFRDSVNIGGIKLTGGDTYNSYIAKYNGSGEVTWALSIENGDIKRMKAAPGGGVIVTGIFYGTLKTKGVSATAVGQGDIFIAKFSGSGELEMLKNFGGAGVDQVSALAFDLGGNILVTGGFGESMNIGGIELNSGGSRSNIFVASFSSNGNANWAKQAGGAGYDYGSGICADRNNNVIITGGMQSPANFNGTNLSTGNSIFVAKYSKNGKLLWANSFGDNSANRGNSVAADSYGNIYLCGVFGGTLKLGYLKLTPQKQLGSFITKLSADGYVAWAKRTDGAAQTRLSVDVADHIYLSGIFVGTADLGGKILNSDTSYYSIFIARYDKDGNTQWAEKYDPDNLF